MGLDVSPPAKKVYVQIDQGGRKNSRENVREVLGFGTGPISVYKERAFF